MRIIINLIILGFTFNSVFSQNIEFNEFVSTLPIIQLPLVINTFDAYSAKDKSINQIEEYNRFALNTVKKFKNRGGIKVEPYDLQRYSWNNENSKYDTYLQLDSNLVQFIGRITYGKGIHILIKKRYFSSFMYYEYELLSFSDDGQRISKKLLFQMYDESYAYDDIKSSCLPIITSNLKADKSIIITWSDYEGTTIQTFRLNDEGLFYLEKSESKEVKN